MKQSEAVGWKLIVSLVFLALATAGCGKPGSAAKLPPELEAKLAEIKKAGEPVTLVELDAFYPKVLDADNAALLYAQAFQTLTADDLKSPGILDKNQRTLELLREASKKTQSRYPVDLKQGEQASMAHLSKLKDCALLLMMDAIRQTAAGHTGPATDDLVTCLALGRSLELEPTLIGQVTRFRVDQSAVTGLQEMLSLRPFTAADLKRQSSAFAEAEQGSAGTFARGLTGERAMVVSLFLEPAKYTAGAMEMAGKTMSESEVERYRASAKGAEDFGFCLEMMNSGIALAKRQAPDYLDGLGEWKTRSLNAKAKGLAIALALLPSAAVALERDAANLSELRQCQAVLAIEQYRVAHNGALPPSLAALVPRFLSAVPVDPFDGKPIRYKKKAPKGYIVYSVGPDRQDDNGTEMKPNAANEAKADLVLTINR